LEGTLLKLNLTSNVSTEELGRVLAKWEFVYDDTRFQAFHFGIEPKEDLCKKVVEYTQDISLKSEACLSLAKEFIDMYNSQPNLPHRKKRHYLEDTIGILLEVVPEAEEKNISLLNDIYFTIAEAYLLRSKIYRPKGVTVPERKKEGLRKALEWIEKIDFEKLAEAYLVKAEIYLELERILKLEGTDQGLPNDAEDVFEQAVKCGEEPDIIAQIAVRWAELRNDINATKDILQTEVLNQQDVSNLEKARAAFLLGGVTRAGQYLKNLGDELKRCYFSNPLWDHAVYFLKESWDRETDLWKDASIKLWKACEEKVRETSSLHIRWHWSRQRDLYDLAFLAADSPQEKVEIADSLKSLPPLRWKAWYQEAEVKEGFEKYLRQEEEALGKRYIKAAKPIKVPPPSKIPFTSLPAPWIAIHFYLNHLEKKGYALIYDSENKDWKKNTFEFFPIFEAFEVWQTNYFEKKIDAAPFLEGLCKEIGKRMPFLFQLPKRPVLFITHDFIHRLPLHAAINENGEFFLENHATMYLPAWGFVKTEDKRPTTNRICLKNYYEYPFLKINNCVNYCIDPATGRDLQGIKESPELLVILCHGIADLVNPFRARLDLAEGGITHGEILGSQFSINDSMVVLGACDTNLVPPITTALDEDLSLNAAFLIKGAREVVGTLWEVYPQEMEDFISSLNNSSSKGLNVAYIIQRLQKDAVEQWRKKARKEPKILYASMCFKTVGYSVPRSTHERGIRR